MTKKHDATLFMTFWIGARALVARVRISAYKAGGEEIVMPEPCFLKRESFFCGFALFVALIPFSALAQEAPAPRNAPRTPVHQQILAGSKTGPLSRFLEGPATILDTERLRIERTDVRLFGIVPPQLSAPYGPQARALLDKLNAAGDVTCSIRDRDREGRLLATCHNAQRADFALELLRRGLAVAARGSLHNADIAPAYLATEQTAQAQKLGLWGQTIPQGVSEASIRETAIGKDLAALSVKKDKETDAAPVTQDTAVTAESVPQAKPPIPQAATASQAASQAVPLAATQSAEILGAAVAQQKNTPHQQTASVPVPPVSETVDLSAFSEDSSMSRLPPLSSLPAASFFETYQIFLTGLLLSFTILACVVGLWFVRHQAHREEIRVVAAALRGELMAARSICVARLAQMTSPQIQDAAQAAAISWPRIRIVVFQAVVGRLGLLGGDLSRQIASIYGQASDYAAYYASSQASSCAETLLASKLKALDSLVLYMDEVLPRLASLEQGGRGGLSFAPPSGPPLGTKNRPPLASAKPKREGVSRQAEDLKPVVVAEEKAEDSNSSSAAMEAVETSSLPAYEPEPKPKIEQKQTTAPAASLRAGAIWDKIKNFTDAHLTKMAPSTCPVEGEVDYSSLSAEEMEALAYGEGPAAERAARAVAHAGPETRKTA